MIFINPCPPGQILYNQFRTRQILVVQIGANTGQRYFYLRYASHASLPFLQSRSQRQRSFCSATGITNLWKNPKRNISDRLADKIVFVICKFICQSKKPWARWFDFDCVHTILYDLKLLRKTFSSISSEITLQWKRKL